MQFKHHSFMTKHLWVGSHNSDAGDRDVLIDEARQLFGEDAVIPVSNFNTLKLKSLLLDIGKFHGVSAQEIFDLTRGLEEEVMPHAKDESTEKSVFVLAHDDCMEYSERYKNFMEQYPKVKNHIELLFMQNKSCFSVKMGILTSNGYKTVREIQQDDDIAYLSSKGIIEFNSEFDLIFQGKKKVFEVCLENGQKLELTHDHEVCTRRGYIKVSDLTCEDEILDLS